MLALSRIRINLLRVFLVLLFCLVPFASHSNYSYQYDELVVTESHKNIEVESKNQHYDGTANLCYRCIHSSAENLQKKARDGSFFAFEVGLVATKGGSVGAMKRLEFVASPKHGNSARQTSKGVSNPGPTNGQHSLDNSLQVKGTSPRRVGVDKANNEITVFDQTSQGIFHGHTRSFKELTSQQQNVLRNSGMVDRKGNIR